MDAQRQQGNEQGNGQSSTGSALEKSAESGNMSRARNPEDKKLGLTTQEAGTTVKAIVEGGISAITDQSVNTLKELGDIAEKGSSYVMLVLGSFLILMSFVWKTQIGGVGVSNLAPSEFIAAVLTGALLIVGGASLRTYNNNIKRTMYLSGLQTSEEVSGKAMQAVKELQQAHEEGYQRHMEWREEELRAQRDDARQRAKDAEEERRMAMEDINKLPD